MIKRQLLLLWLLLSKSAMLIVSVLWNQCKTWALEVEKDDSINAKSIAMEITFLQEKVLSIRRKK